MSSDGDIEQQPGPETLNVLTVIIPEKDPKYTLYLGHYSIKGERPSTSGHKLYVIPLSKRDYLSSYLGEIINDGFDFIVSKRFDLIINFGISRSYYFEIYPDDIVRFVGLDDY